MSPPNYIEQRATILAEFFLRDLNPKFLAQASFQGSVWEYMAAFQGKEGKLINIAVEVKSTEAPISSEHIFPGPVNWMDRVNSNLPILVLVVDVKTNSLAWNWASKATVIKDPSDPGRALIRLPVIKNSRQTAETLMMEIESM